jgi:hypothetical protein
MKAYQAPDDTGSINPVNNKLIVAFKGLLQAIIKKQG